MLRPSSDSCYCRMDDKIPEEWTNVDVEAPATLREGEDSLSGVIKRLPNVSSYSQDPFLYLVHLSRIRLLGNNT